MGWIVGIKVVGTLFFFQIKIKTKWNITKTHVSISIWPKNPKTPEMRVTRKIFTQVAANISFNPFSGDVLFPSLATFALFVFLFFCLFACFLKLEIYSDTYSTMRTGEWKKLSTRPISRNRNTFFSWCRQNKNENYAKMRSLVSKNLVNHWLKNVATLPEIYLKTFYWKISLTRSTIIMTLSKKHPFLLELTIFTSMFKFDI